MLATTIKFLSKQNIWRLVSTLKFHFPSGLANKIPDLSTAFYLATLITDSSPYKAQQINRPCTFCRILREVRTSRSPFFFPLSSHSWDTPPTPHRDEPIRHWWMFKTNTMLNGCSIKQNPLQSFLQSFKVSSKQDLTKSLLLISELRGRIRVVLC